MGQFKIISVFGVSKVFGLVSGNVAAAVKLFKLRFTAVNLQQVEKHF